MSNLGITQVSSSQNQKEVTINNADARLENAMTEISATIPITNTNAVTVTATQMQTALKLVFDEDGTSPATAASIATFPTTKRGLFIVANNMAFDLTCTIASQPLTAPVVPAGAVSLLYTDGVNIQKFSSTNLTALFVSKSGDTMAGSLVVDNGGSAGITVNVNPAIHAIQVKSAGASNQSGYFSMWKARGSLSVPTTVSTNDLLNLMLAYGYGATTYIFAGDYKFRVIDAAPSDTSMASQFEIDLCRIGSATVENALKINIDTGLSIYGSLLVDNNRIIKRRSYTVATLPSASAGAGAGGAAFVTDSNATTFGAIVAGGGSNGVPVYSDGTNWRIG